MNVDTRPMSHSTPIAFMLNDNPHFFEDIAAVEVSAPVLLLFCSVLIQRHRASLV